MLENAFHIDNAMLQNRDTSSFPIKSDSLLGSLAKALFSNVLGHTIRKPTWIDSSFLLLIDCISGNLSHYYRGSSNKKNLYRVQYILALSWLQTLARKHNSTVRLLLKKGNSQLVEELYTEQEEVLSLIFPRASFLYRGDIGGKWGIWLLFASTIWPIMNDWFWHHLNWNWT